MNLLGHILIKILLLPTPIWAFIENYIIGTPKVICEENDVALDVITSKPFEGNIFVKGRAKDASCRQSYSANGTNAYALPLGKCGMQRLRSANPRGVSFSITVIVSFHPAGFITKNDRAFHVKCFYMEPDEIVTNSFEVSGLPTTELQDEMHMPTCDYSVRSGGINGPPSTFANVGETVYHVWECKGNDMGMLVKKCFVTDGDGEDHAVIDFDGCSTDTSLLSQVTYDDSLMQAHAQSQVFKYADSNQLYFTCQIRLCQKQMGMCDGITPPDCGSNRNSTSRQKRALFRNELEDFEVDVATPEMLVLSRDELLQLGKTEFCMSKIFLPLVPLSLFTLVSLTASLTLLCYRHCVYYQMKKDDLP